MIGRHVSRTDDKGRGAWPGEAAGRASRRPESGADRVSSVEPCVRVRSPSEGPFVDDETERTRLMADIMRLLARALRCREAHALAGLTLVGWLARRRPEEAPHAIGIDEARESERRIQSRLAARLALTRRGAA